jgi:hypothetical protein
MQNQTTADELPTRLHMLADAFLFHGSKSR